MGFNGRFSVQEDLGPREIQYMLGELFQFQFLRILQAKVGHTRDARILLQLCIPIVNVSRIGAEFGAKVIK
jgi:hypothetical protein